MIKSLKLAQRNLKDITIQYMRSFSKSNSYMTQINRSINDVSGAVENGGSRVIENQQFASSYYTQEQFRKGMRSVVLTKKPWKIEYKNTVNNQAQINKYSFASDKQQVKPSASSHLATLLSQSKQQQHLTNLLVKFKFQSQKKEIDYMTYGIQGIQSFILNPLLSLSQSVNDFLLQLQIEAMSQIDRFKVRNQTPSLNSDRQYRENLLIQIEERKIFYRKLYSFLGSVTKQFMILFQSKYNLEQNQRTVQEHHSNESKGSMLISGQYFKHCFTTQNYTQIYEQIHKSKQEYLLKSKKLKSYSILNIKQYQTNYSLKLRLLIKVLSQIKQIYQAHLINCSKISQLSSKQLPLSQFLSQKIISPVEYADLLEIYFNHFSQQSIKNFLFMSIGYHSPEISQLNKQLIDVKIRQTKFKYNLQKLCSVYRLEENEWLYNTQDLEQNTTYQQGISPQQSNKRYYQSLENKKKNQFQRHKQYCFYYAKLILRQIGKQKQKSARHIELQDLGLSETYQSDLKNVQYLLTSEYGLSFNQLFPPPFFTITDIQQLHPLIQESMITLMVNPFQAYQSLTKYLDSKQSTVTLTKHMDSKQSTFICQDEYKNAYLSSLSKLMKQIEQNMTFLSRFFQWNFQSVIQLKQYLNLYYQYQIQSIVSELRLLVTINSQIADCLEQDAKNDLGEKPIHQYNHLRMLCRVINVIYNIRNNINPIHIEDFVQSVESIQKRFKRLFIQQLCQKIGMQVLSTIKTIESFILSQFQKQTFQPSLLRFRVLATFLDLKIIDFGEFFTLLLKINQTSSKQNQDHLSYLYYSDGLQKSLYIITNFKQTNPTSYQLLISGNLIFAKFSQKLFLFQKKFNTLLQVLQYPQQSFSQQKHSELNNLKQNFMQNNKKLNTEQKLIRTLEFCEQNDLLYKRNNSDEQNFIIWLGKSNTNKKQQKELQFSNKKLVHKSPRQNFDNELNILLILSQNNSFLSSTMQLSYFGYLKNQIQKLYGFDQFHSSWNYPFYADIALVKKRLCSNKFQKLFIKTLSTSSNRARGRFFKQEGSLRKNFMGIFQQESNQIVRAQFPQRIYGTQSQRNQILQFTISIDKGLQLMNTIKNWLSGTINLIQKKQKQDKIY